MNIFRRNPSHESKAPTTAIAVLGIFGIVLANCTCRLVVMFHSTSLNNFEFDPNLKTLKISQDHTAQHLPSPSGLSLGRQPKSGIAPCPPWRPPPRSPLNKRDPSPAARKAVLVAQDGSEEVLQGAAWPEIHRQVEAVLSLTMKC